VIEPSLASRFPENPTGLPENAVIPTNVAPQNRDESQFDCAPKTVLQGAARFRPAFAIPVNVWRMESQANVKLVG
jgi:hypothetical protein